MQIETIEIRNYRLFREAKIRSLAISMIVIELSSIASSRP